MNQPPAVRLATPRPAAVPLPITLAAVAFLAFPALLAAQEPKELKPTPKAPPHQVHRWQSKDGLRYAWCLPKGYDEKQPVVLTVICHGTGLDYRWGFANHPPGVFRPDDVVVSVDGPSPGPNGSRLFLGEPKDVKAFVAFLDEMRDTFAVERVLLYGHSQGGFFVVHFAGERPDAVAGVVAHASGAWSHSRMAKPVHKVAIAFVHGTADPVVPYGQSPGARDAYVDAGFPLVQLRRLDGYNHWPNAVRTNECLWWCDGMTAATPERALHAAEQILERKPADEYQWQTVVGYGAARQVLGRIVGDEKPTFAGVDGATKEKAQRLVDAVEREGQEHVAALQKQVAKKGDLVIGPKGAPWLGHLVPLREDFRGVRSVEAYFAAIDFDDARKAQAKAFRNVLNAWYDDKLDDAAKLRAMLANLPEACLCEGLPAELQGKIGEWTKASKKRPGKAEAAAAAKCEAFFAGWKSGRDAYAKIWKKWK